MPPPPPLHPPTQWAENQPPYARVEDSLLKRRTSAHSLSPEGTRLRWTAFKEPILFFSFCESCGPWTDSLPSSPCLCALLWLIPTPPPPPSRAHPMPIFGGVFLPLVRFARVTPRDTSVPQIRRSHMALVLPNRALDAAGCY